MLWTPEGNYEEKEFGLEEKLEAAILEVREPLFGRSRIYLPVKRIIGQIGKIRNIPDAYLIDLASKKRPTLYVVENELATHHYTKHIALQLMEFSLSFESDLQKVKGILISALSADEKAYQQCQNYAEKNGFRNVDYLLEKMVYENGFKVLLIIDEMPDQLMKVLHKLRFPVEILTLQRFSNESDDRVAYRFKPFLDGIPEPAPTGTKEKEGTTIAVDPSDIDTVVAPAREDGFQEVFLGENRWHHIRIHSSMMDKIKYIAAYQVAPVSAITYIAKVREIKPWKDTNKYELIFESPATKIDSIKLGPKGGGKVPQGPRYTSMKRINGAKNLDDVF